MSIGSLLSWVVILSALGYALKRLGLGYPRCAGFRRLRAGEVAFLDAAAEVMFPGGGAIPLSGRDAEIPRYVDGYLDVLPPRVRLQIHAMLLLVEQATIFFPAPGRGGLRRFSALDLAQRERALQGWSSSRLFQRRFVFTALRAVLTMGYLGHPAALSHLQLGPYAFDTPICEADLLYPPIGAGPEAIRYSRVDLTPPSDGTPLALDGPRQGGRAGAAS